MVRSLAQHIGETIYFLEGDGYFVASYSPSFRYLGFSETRSTLEMGRPIRPRNKIRNVVAGAQT